EAPRSRRHLSGPGSRGNEEGPPHALRRAVFAKVLPKDHVTGALPNPFQGPVPAEEIGNTRNPHRGAARLPRWPSDRIAPQTAASAPIRPQERASSVGGAPKCH